MSINLVVAPRRRFAAALRVLGFAALAAAGCPSDSHSEATSDASAQGADASTQSTDAAVTAPPRSRPQAASDAGADDDPLPAAFKGYELYAWDEDGDVSYTLITGTNRQKTLDEITGPDSAMDAGEWVLIHGQGLDALEHLLARVPAGTEVILTALDGLPALSAAQHQAVVDLLSP